MHQGLAILRAGERAGNPRSLDLKAQMMVHDPNKRTNLAFLSHRLFYVSVLKSIKWSEKDREMRDVYLITSFLKNPF